MTSQKAGVPPAQFVYTTGITNLSLYEYWFNIGKVFWQKKSLILPTTCLWQFGQYLCFVTIGDQDGMVYDNDYSSIIDRYFYDTFSTLTQTFNACAQLFRHPV